MRSRRPLRARRPRGGTANAADATHALVIGAVAAVLVVACSGSAPVTARQPDADTVAAAITEDGLRARLQALAAATDHSSGYRAVGSDGYDRAVGSDGYDRAATLVEKELRAAGWTVTPDA